MAGPITRPKLLPGCCLGPSSQVCLQMFNHISSVQTFQAFLQTAWEELLRACAGQLLQQMSPAMLRYLLRIAGVIVLSLAMNSSSGLGEGKRLLGKTLLCLAATEPYILIVLIILISCRLPSWLAKSKGAILGLGVVCIGHDKLQHMQTLPRV